MDRKDKSRKSSSSAASMAALAAAAASGAGAGGDRMAPPSSGDEDQKPNLVNVPVVAAGASSSSAAVRRGGSGAAGGPVAASGAGAGGPSCQAERCPADLSEAKRYHRRHKVCEAHAKAAVVLVAGLRQRFCQQCSRFHELLEFDDTKRSCRRRLAGHNERRRKSSADANGGDGCRHVDQDGRSNPGNPPPLNHFQIR